MRNFVRYLEAGSWNQPGLFFFDQLRYDLRRARRSANDETNNNKDDNDASNDDSNDSEILD